MGVHKLNGQIARIENAFIENARYNLSVREQKIILYLIAGVDPRKENFERVTIPVKEIELALKSDNKKWGGLYKEMDKFARLISQKQITFMTDIEVEGRPLSGYINWFSHVMPTKNKYGEVCIEFEFAPILKTFLLNLKEFVQIDRADISAMKHFYSIRLYQLFKSWYQKQSNYRKIISKTYDVEELRKLLNLEDKYPTFKNFTQHVLNPSIKEINEKSSLNIDKTYRRNTHRKVIAIEFKITSKKDMPTQLSLLKSSIESNERMTRDKMTKKEVERRVRQFNFSEFSKKYRKDYTRIFNNTKKALGKSVDPNSDGFKMAVRNACETWFIENIAT